MDGLENIREATSSDNASYLYFVRNGPSDRKLHAPEIA